MGKLSLWPIDQTRLSASPKPSITFITSLSERNEHSSASVCTINMQMSPEGLGVEEMYCLWHLNVASPHSKYANNAFNNLIRFTIHSRSVCAPLTISEGREPEPATDSSEILSRSLRSDAL